MKKSFYTSFMFCLIISSFYPAYSQQDSVEIIVSQLFLRHSYADRTEDERKLRLGAFDLLLLAEAADTSAIIKEEFYLRLKFENADSNNRVGIHIKAHSIDGVNEIAEYVKALIEY